MYLIIGADVVPTNSNIDLFISANATDLVGDELLGLLRNAQANVFNLEVPFARKETPIRKCGPNLIANPDSIAGFKALNITHVTLANNHILDQGSEGLQCTINTLSDSGIEYVGVSDTIKNAGKPMYIDLGCKKIGFYACVEHEFSVATDNSSGANPYDPLFTFDSVREIKKTCDYLIVLYHGGKELYQYPSPELRRRCRHFVEAGADMILCQHSHCIGCEEVFKDGIIVYGQGNFIFDYSNHELWKTGMLIKINDDLSHEKIWLTKNINGVRKANKADSLEISKQYNDRTISISQDGFIETQYKKFAAEMRDSLLLSIHGREGFVTKILNKISGGRWRKIRLKRIYRDKYNLELRNRIECESWRELLIESLGDIN